ncbi:MAG: CRTAC1 family protein [Capsulimonadales bacterium]|nr:CRTAC1 family protein [Capsulimonadales bacterium]
MKQGLKQTLIPRLFVTLFFVGLIATAATLSRRNAQPESATFRGAHAGGDSRTRYGFQLTEVSAQSGVKVVHTAPRLDPKLEPILPRINDMGAGVAVADFDRDGWPDFFLTDSGENSRCHLFRNKKDGTFEDVAATMGVADLNKVGDGSVMGAVWGDYDNDGFEDLLVYKWGKAILFHNEGGQRFTPVADAGLPKWMNCNVALWLDYDADGKLDILMCGYFDEKHNLWNLPSTRIMPNSIEYATNGTRKYLLRGDGTGRFTDVTAEVGIDTKAWTLAAAACDLDGNGFPEIFLANDYGKAELWQNEGGKRFRNISAASGVGDKPKAGMNAALGDVLNTGQFGIYVSNISEEATLLQGNNLWMPKASARPGELVYDNLAGDMGVELGGWSFGAQFVDLNNDGFQDLYLVNGYISADPNQSYWYDYSKVAQGNAEIIQDALLWPPIKGRSLSGFQQKRVWLSDGAGRFSDVAQAVGVTDRHDGRGIAYAYLNNNGQADILVANQKGPFLLYRNDVTPENHWIGFDLEGTRSNRSAIGAVVTVHWNGWKQSQYVSGGVGFCAQNDRRPHFGLGKNAKVDRVEIRWPSGTTRILEAPETNKVHKIKES